MNLNGFLLFFSFLTLSIKKEGRKEGREGGREERSFQKLVLGLLKKKFSIQNIMVMVKILE